MLYYLWYWLGYDMEDKKEVIENYDIVIKKDDVVYLRKQFNKELAYQDVVKELKKVLKPI